MNCASPASTDAARLRFELQTYLIATEAAVWRVNTLLHLLTCVTVLLPLLLQTIAAGIAKPSTFAAYPALFMFGEQQPLDSAVAARLSVALHRPCFLL
jgi:hypothetical protein